MLSKADTLLKPFVRRGVILGGGCGGTVVLRAPMKKDAVGVGE